MRAEFRGQISIGRKGNGRTVDVELQRKGQKRIVKVTLGRLTEDETTADGKKAGAGPSETAPSSKALIGLGISPLTDELRAKFNIGKTIKGVVVTEVDPQSAVASKNIKVGDVIVEAAQEAVTGLEDIAKAIDKIKKIGRKQMLLRVEDSKGDMRFVAVPLE